MNEEDVRQAKALISDRADLEKGLEKGFLNRTGMSGGFGISTDTDWYSGSGISETRRVMYVAHRAAAEAAEAIFKATAKDQIRRINEQLKALGVEPV